MKKLLLVLVALTVVFSFVGIAGAKTLRVGVAADIVSFDIQEQLSGETLQFSHWVYDPLLRWDKNHQLENRIATKTEQIDDKTTRVYLRNDVYFHSGNKMTSKDVKFAFDRLQVSVDFKNIVAPIAMVMIVDDYTIDVITTAVYPLILNVFPNVFPMDSKMYEGIDKNGKSKAICVKGPSYTFAKTDIPSGTGAFQVVSWEHGVKLVLKRNKNYWDKSTGNIDEIVLTPIREAATRVAAVLAGDIDFMFPVPPQDFKRFATSKKADLVDIPGSRTIHIQMNGVLTPPIANTKVRQAIVYATNNVGIAQKLMKGTATPIAQWSPEGYMGRNDNLKLRFDLEKAKKLMKEAGFEKGFKATMIAPNNRYVNDEKIAQAFVAMMAKINIDISLQTMPRAQYWDEFVARKASFAMLGWHSDTEDSANFYEYLQVCWDEDKGLGTWNAGQYCNPEVDKLVVASATEVDVAKRSAILQQIEQMIYDDAGFIPLHVENLSFGVKKGLDISDIINVLNFPYLGDLEM